MTSNSQRLSLSLAASLAAAAAASLLAFAAPAAHAAPAAVQGVPLTDASAERITDNPVLAEKTAQFRAAIRSNNASRVKSFLEEGFTPNFMMENGDTAFTYAMRSDSKAAAEALLDSGLLDVNKPNRFGETPLMLAVFKGDKGIFEKLLSLGADPKGGANWTPLHYAATSGLNDFTKRLLELGADPNAQTRAGVTPLIMAARKPSREVVMTLLRAGAYRDYCTDRGLSPADFAKKAGDEELAKYLEVKSCAVIGKKPAAQTSASAAAPAAAVQPANP